MDGYYEETLSAHSLRRCYELASPRVLQYLTAETEFALQHVRPYHRVLDLGCGYGRTLREMAAAVALVVGIDVSAASLQLAAETLADVPNCLLLHMDATRLAFVDASFDVVTCLQNGASAFRLPLTSLIDEALRVVRPGGLVLLSTYSPRFWEHRLEWFERQAQASLIGAIDRRRTGAGVIVCEDGFTATTLDLTQVQAAAGKSDAQVRMVEVDDSSVFFVLERVT